MSGLRALYGSRLYEQPKHAHVPASIAGFLERPGQLGVEIGFDHGMCLLDRARRFPEWKQLGVEIRERQVTAVAPHAPPNALVLRVDGRTLLGNLLPDACIDALYLLFPTPPKRASHTLLTTGFRDQVVRTLKPEAAFWFKTDVPELADAFDALFPWATAPPPPLGVELSRRERVCQRDGTPVFTRCVRHPS